MMLLLNAFCLVNRIIDLNTQESNVYHTRDPLDGNRTCAELTLVHYPNRLCHPGVWWLNETCAKVCDEYRDYLGSQIGAGITGSFLLIGFLVTFCCSDPARTKEAIRNFRSNLPLNSYPQDIISKIENLLRSDERKLDHKISVKNAVTLLEEIKKSATLDRNAYIQSKSLDLKQPERMLRNLRSIYINQLKFFNTIPQDRKDNLLTYDNESKADSKDRDVALEITSPNTLREPLLDKSIRKSQYLSCVVM